MLCSTSRFCPAFGIAAAAMPCPPTQSAHARAKAGLASTATRAESTPAAPGHHRSRSSGIALRAPGTAPEKLIAPLHRSSTARTRELLRVNLESALSMLGAWIESRRAACGAAVLVSSMVAQIGAANHEAIAAAKAGIEALVRRAATPWPRA
ncbi:hypothetical protein THIX_90270 [Thiomonas sp. X19]|nr:hypothetical protein THIX_90270 [Thiomonas sp. X19]